MSRSRNHFADLRVVSLRSAELRAISVINVRESIEPRRKREREIFPRVHECFHDGYFLISRNRIYVIRASASALQNVCQFIFLTGRVTPIRCERINAAADWLSNGVNHGIREGDFARVERREIRQARRGIGHDDGRSDTREASQMRKRGIKIFPTEPHAGRLAARDHDDRGDAGPQARTTGCDPNRIRIPLCAGVRDH